MASNKYTERAGNIKIVIERGLKIVGLDGSCTFPGEALALVSRKRCSQSSIRISACRDFFHSFEREIQLRAVMHSQ